MSKLTFEEWMKQVNLAIAKLASGLDSRCLPDFDYYAYFNASMSPKTTAKDAVKAARNC